MLVSQRRCFFLIIARIGVICFASIFAGNDASAANVKTTATVYAWQQNATADWQSPTSWMPARISPASSDILEFNQGGTTTPTNVPTESIGQLIISGNTIVNLQSATAIILTIVGGDGDDLTVERNSALDFNGSNAITASLGSGASAAINGSMMFLSSSISAHRLIANDSGAITFGDGAVFTAGLGFTGNPFGTTGLNSVIFDSGSTYISIAGADPFGATEPASVVTFKEGSLFSLRGNAQTSFFSGRTYANFELNYPGGDQFAEGSSPLIMDDLILTAGQFHFWMTGTGHSIHGNITTQPGTSLDMQATFLGQTIYINGKGPQKITILGHISMNPANTVAIDNPSGVTVTTIFAAWNLELINGVVAVTNDLGFFHVSGSVSRVNGYIIGSLRRVFNDIGTATFDVGTENGYSPATVEVTAGHDFYALVRVKAIQAAEPQISDPSRALSRYWQITGAENITGANLVFNYLDPNDIPPSATESNFVIQRYSNGFTQPAGVIDTQVNAFRATGLTDLSMADWTLAEPSAVSGTPTATATPTGTSTPPGTPTFTPTSTPTGPSSEQTGFDYDGDHKSDISVFRPSEGAWYLQRSQAGLFGMLFGFGTDKIAPADYDGDGKTDIAVYRPSTGIWYVFNSSNGTVSYYVFGLADDLPTPADYDGDGKADVSVFRPSTGTWYRQNSSNGSYFGVQFGASEDRPTIGDFDGDGKADIAVFRPSTGAWYRINSSDVSIHGELFGFGSDILAPADYDGDGKTDLAVYRPSTGIWYLHNSADSSYSYNVFGLAEDIPAAGDFDGDGKADICVFRRSDGTWYRENSSNGQFVAFQFGTSGDQPTQAAFRY
jgi:hypothetical protein